MHTSGSSRALWRATAAVTLIDVLDSIARRYLWSSIDWTFPDDPDIIQPDQETEAEPDPYKFWLRTLPTVALWAVLITPVIYKWQVWLERTFPGRRRVDAPVASSSRRSEKVDAIGSDDENEEEVMKRLIAKGKVQRVGFSWINTIIKWMLDTFLANLVFLTLHVVYKCLMRWESWELIKLNVQMEVPPGYIFNFLSFGTFMSFIAFVTVPTQHRVTFLAATSCACNIFLGSIFRVLVPFFLNLEWTKEHLRAATEAMRQANATANSTASRLEIGEL